jgi:lipid II:glycine glycyltransferase (peptidoglycan interpeptide bridge formation enzyme)
MNLKISLVVENERRNWDKFITEALGADFLSGAFLQSWDWGEFRARLGHQIFRIKAAENKKILGVCFWEKRSVTLGQSYFYIPRGPVVQKKKKASGTFFKILEFVEELAEKEKVFLVRWDAPLEAKAGSLTQVSPSLARLGLQDINNQVEPKHTLVIDLAHSESALLDSFSSRVKRNLNRARRHRIKIKLSELNSDNGRSLGLFSDLLQETAQRQKVEFYSKEYFEKLAQYFGRHLRLFLAYYQGQPIAGALVVAFGSTATYLYGASTRTPQNTGAPWMLHWEIIKYFKSQNLRYYDFWGIGQKNEQGKFWPRGWQGLTFFKTGFNGQKVSYLGAYDLPVRPLVYRAYKCLRQKPK